MTKHDLFQIRSLITRQGISLFGGVGTICGGWMVALASGDGTQPMIPRWDTNCG